MSFLCSYTKIYPGLEFGNELITIDYKKVLLIFSWRYVDMKKMSFPKLEVIQFNTEDVIVTSGGGASSITKGFLIGTSHSEERSSKLTWPNSNLIQTEKNITFSMQLKM